MENQKTFAIILAVLAAVLVVLAGKSCSADTKQEKSPSVVNNGLNNVEVIHDTTTAFNYGGANINNPASDSSDNILETPSEELTEGTKIMVEYATDLLGRVISTSTYTVMVTTTQPASHIVYVTDLLGRVTRTEIVDGPPPTTAPVSTTKDLLSDFHERHPETTESTTVSVPRPTTSSWYTPGVDVTTIHIVIN